MLPSDVRALCQTTCAALSALTADAESAALCHALRTPQARAACQVFETALQGTDLEHAQWAALRYQVVVLSQVSLATLQEVS